MKCILASATTLSIAAFAVQISFAQPTGSITNQVTDAANVLWDFSKLTNELQNIGYSNANFVLIYADTFTQDGGGKFSGLGSDTAATVVTGLGEGSTPFTNDITAPYKVSGSVTSAKGLARLLFTTKMSGTVESNGRTRTFSFSDNYTIKVDAVSGQVSGRWAGSARLSGGGGATRTSSFNGQDGPYPLTDYLAEVGNGAWTLVLDFGAANGNKLKGTATVALNSGEVYNFGFTGTFTPHTGQSKLNLKASDVATKGSLLQVTLEGNQITKIVGQVSGQSVNIKQ